MAMKVGEGMCYALIQRIKCIREDIGFSVEISKKRPAIRNIHGCHYWGYLIHNNLSDFSDPK